MTKRWYDAELIVYALHAAGISLTIPMPKNRISPIEFLTMTIKTMPQDQLNTLASKLASLQPSGKEKRLYPGLTVEERDFLIELIWNYKLFVPKKPEPTFTNVISGETPEARGI